MDPDRKEVTWNNLYKILYTERAWVLWKYFDFDNLNKYNQAPIRTNIVWDSEENTPELRFVRDYRDVLKVSGDADITIKRDSAEYPCMHRFPNFSLMLCTGGMNDAKGKRALAVFLRLLDTYYHSSDKSKDIDLLFRNVGRKYKDKEKQAYMLQHKKNCLMDFLALNKDIYTYCKHMYQIEEYMVDDILKQKNDKDIMSSYWNYRYNLMKELGVDIGLLSEDIGKEEYQ